jgi:hypothetical protein
LEKKYKNIILRQLKNVNFDFADAYRVDPKVASPIVKIFRSGAGPFVQDKSRTKPRLVLKKKA